jgi:hypothetical protein
LNTILLGLLVIAPMFWPVVAAQPAAGTIAYVLPNDQQGDEIHLIQPDGSGDHRIWRTNQPDLSKVKDIYSLAWHPDATELAFASDHEGACSILDSDLYSILPDGSGYRRITQAPACAELAAYPKGTVHVPVLNLTFQVVFIYIQGAPEIQMVTGDSVTFTDVADFGDGVMQTALAIGGGGRWVSASAIADVQPNQEVTTPLITVSGTPFSPFGASGPAWRGDGSELAYTFGFGSLTRIASHPAPLSFGSDLLGEGVETPLSSTHLAWGPTAATANQLLYAGNAGGVDIDVPTGIYRTTAGSDSAGQRLVSFESYDSVYGLAWLPDGSGFVYSVTEQFLHTANVFVYRFATQESTRLTDYEYETHFAGLLSVSPDGQQVVFERAVKESEFSIYLVDHELWMVNIDGSNLHRLAAKGRAPAWSPRDPHVIPIPTETPVVPSGRRSLLPLVTRPRTPGGGGANLLQNPGFEASLSALTPWVARAGTTWQVMSDITHTGTNSLNLYSGMNGIDSVYQVVTLPASATRVTVAYWYKWLSIETQPNADRVCIALSAPQASSPTWERCLDVAGKDNQEWAQAQYTLSGQELTALKGKPLELAVSVYTDADRFTEVWLDDVSLVVTE